MTDEDQKFQRKALSLSHTKTAISTIKEKLSPQQLQKFQDSCFGHLLLIEDLKWTAQIIWAFEVFPALAALHFVMHEENGYIPRILQWRSNTSARFHELMSQVFENCDQQPFWSWGDNDENTEEIVELFANEAQENASTFVEEKDDEVEETTTLPLSSKGKLLSTELCILKCEFQTTKNELEKNWKNSGIKALRDLMNPPIITNVTVAGDEAIKGGSATVEKHGR
ncbi:unnamed protein product [Prunus brigantina]